MGDYLVGIRTNDVRVDRALRQALATHFVPDVATPHANYAIRIEPQVSGEAIQQLHALYEGGCLVVKSRRPGEVIAALVRELSVYPLTRSGATLVRCTVIVRKDGSAVLLSAALRRQLAANASRLASQGLNVLATSAVVIEAGTAEVMVPAPAITLSREGFAALSDGDHSIDRELAERRLRVTAWVFFSAPGALVPIGRAQAVALARAALSDEVVVTREIVRELAHLLRTATPFGAGDLNTWEVVGRLPETL